MSGLCSGMACRRGEGHREAQPPRPCRKPHATQNVRSPTRAFSDPGWVVAPDMWAAATSRSLVCPCLPATIICKRGRPAFLGGHCPPAPRCRPPRRPHICPQTSPPSPLDKLTPTLLIWLKREAEEENPLLLKGRKACLKKERGCYKENCENQYFTT